MSAVGEKKSNSEPQLRKCISEQSNVEHGGLPKDNEKRCGLRTRIAMKDALIIPSQLLATKGVQRCSRARYNRRLTITSMFGTVTED